MKKKSLREKLRNLEVPLIGNRVTTTGISLMAASLGPFYTNIMLNEVNNISDMPLDTEGNLWAIAGGALFFAGFYALSTTLCGRGTKKVYERTIDHIKEFGRIDSRYADKMLGDERNKPFVGYCQLQGMYLASREMKITDQFKELRKTYPQKIPNF